MQLQLQLPLILILLLGRALPDTANATWVQAECRRRVVGRAAGCGESAGTGTSVSARAHGAGPARGNPDEVRA